MRLRDMIPEPSTLMTVALSSLLGGAVAIGVSGWINRSSTPSDRHFRDIGRRYAAALGPACAEAWREGADSLEQGFPLSTSIARTGRIWDANRARLFDSTLTPEFNRIIPEKTTDDNVSACDRAAMVKAWRKVAEGMEGR